MNEKILEVNNLKVSFKTAAGKVQAVRDISFSLEKGETLAIVGESGSGKSVTSKTIIGINSPNAVIEGGEILYDGKDLLKIDEDTYQNIRGNKIAMIFQDPMSSLNPIVKIGKQLTEAMISKGKVEKRESRKEFNKRLSLLKENMLESLVPQISKEEIIADCQTFDKVSYKYLELQKSYKKSSDAAKSLSSEVKDILFEVEKSAFFDQYNRLKEAYKDASLSIHEYVNDKEELQKDLNILKKDLYPLFKKDKINEIIDCLKSLKAITDKSLQKTSPEYFSLAYYILKNNDYDHSLEINELNKITNEFLYTNFLDEFLYKVRAALEKNEKDYEIKKEYAIIELENALNYYESISHFDKTQSYNVAENAIKAVNNAINPLDIKKETKEYVFEGAIISLLNKLFSAKKNNIKEAKRFEKEATKINKIISKGKTPEWKPIPASIIDEKTVQGEVIELISDLIVHFDLKNQNEVKLDELALENINVLKESARNVVFYMTKKIAKEKALNILNEVGIGDARKRYNQYPFEFSGGMRQRIVIAIALVANPDILICDEPTTALDVTIQANILELINKLKEERQLSIIFITHDLGVVANMADKVAVMYAGKIVEIGDVEEVFYNPRHPYTWALLSSMPDLDTSEKLEAIPGTPPNMIYPPKGDAFASRNKYAMEIDFEEEPPMFKISDTHYAATWLLDPDAPKIDIPKQVKSRIERMKEEDQNDGK